MKRYIHLIIISLLVCYTATAQVDRSKAPLPGPAPEIKIGNYESFQLKNGLKVFVVENHKLPRVAYSLVFKHDPILEKDDVGYVQMAGELIGTATKTRTKDQIDEEVDFIGATLNASSSSVYAASLTKHNEKLLDLMSDIVLNSVFKQDELEKLRKQFLSGLAYSKTDPGSISDNVANVILYGKDYPYGEIETEKSINNINLDMCRQYYKTYYRPNTAYLAIVGDITLKEAKKLITKYFGNWESGDVPSYTYKTPQAPANDVVALVDRPASVQSVIKVMYPVDLKIGSADGIKARVMNTVLGGGTYRLFNNLREKHGYTYGAYSQLSADELVGKFTAYADVRNSVTDSSITQILYEMNRLRSEKVPGDELQRVKNYLTGNFALSLERPETVARFALNIARYNLPKDYYTNYLKNLSNVNSDDVYEMAQKYIEPNHSYIFVVGKSEDVASQLKKFSPDGKIIFYDTEGNIYNPEDKAKALPEGLTGQKVIDKYINAIGGKENYAAIKDLTVKMSTKVQGMSLTIERYQKVPDKLAVLVSMNGNVMQKQLFDGEKGKMIQMGNEKEITGDDLENLKLDAMLDLELNYSKYNVAINLKGIDEVNGKKAYIVDIVYPDGKTTTEYFDVDTGLKLKSVTSVESPQGPLTQTTLYDDYRKKDNVLFPYNLKQSFGPQNMDITVDSIEINTGLNDDLFE